MNVPARIIALALLMLVLTSCGDDRAPAGGEDTVPSADAPYIEKDGEIQVSCGGGGDGWSPSIMAEGIESPISDGEMVEIFEELLANPKYAGELKLSFLADGPDTPWRLLVVDGDEYTLGLDTWNEAGPVDDAFIMGIRQDGDAWAWTGGGNCHLAPVLQPGNTWLGLTLPEGDLDRASTSPTIGVTERECTSGRDPTPYLHDPTVVETDTTVTVYWTSTPPTGGGNCIGPQPTEVPLDLEAPIGDREVLDGSAYPPAPIPASLFG